ncbi:dihydropyrimidinase [Clostridium tetani]|uniref:dihydropyrimidinase n=1 Tax=Clostridium tetani TaxID=1513 RepID=UPI000512D647|nr:dihydropyrimidinase [Clostridium tetani]AVP54314.1 dihydropyrimidinase [Clostridium tetani]KGI44197.1 phenylhydantoinase [Clostridium tetani]RXI52165.1 dihydropyrimidinase [Clostridium tetani]RXI53935.1 dihydropyrimidinase [Clostridium tetani]RXI73069.1 dihydropyrimidinase [Clostridium tetani]
MQNFDTIIKNGTIVTASDTYKGDIGIKDGKVVQIGLDLEDSGKKIIDAGDKYIFPGGIDPHTHMDMPFGGTFSSDDFLTGTKAAACGGTTTIVDFAVQPKGKTLKETTKIWREKADNKACIDYGIHIAITDMNDEILEEMEEVIKEGYSSFKLFMTYEGMRVEDDTLMRALMKARDKGGVICVHAENHYVIDYFIKKLLKEGKTEPKYHAISRPELCEGEAAGRAIKLAEICGAPLYIVHNSCEASVSEIERARKLGYPIMGETCPQYLLLSYENYEEEGFNGAKYVMSPPLRDKKNWEHIWKALSKDTLQVVATDHCPFFMEQKRMGIDSFNKIPNGAPGVELRMSLMYTYGVLEDRISLQRFVEVTSTNAAKIFGMYPQKGTIAVGSDADLIIFDPNKEIEIKEENLNENVDYTPYEGFKLKGYPVMTLLRGEVIAKNGKFVGQKGVGKFVKRGKGDII